MPSVFLFATLDTKGREGDFVRGLLVSYGVSVTLVDVGALGTPAVAADISRDRIFELAGTTIEAVRKNADRGDAVTKAAAGAARLAREAYANGDLSGLLGLGGSAGTTIATTAMQALPLGVPKVMLSTLASGMVRQFVGDKDIFMLNSVVDIAGINRVSREVLVFHATGNGGQAMESLIGEGLIAGVLDVTTTELADEHVGGFLSAGPDRLTAAGKAGIPQVVSTGALDMANFYAPESVPAKFKDRLFYKHNANVTLMRTTPEENTRIGAAIAHKLSAATGPVAILLPARGVSAIDKEGQPFDDPVARKALHDAIRSGVHGIPVTELDLHINDPEFADAAANKLLELMRINVGEGLQPRPGRV